MPKSQHQEPEDVNLYHKGVNSDDDQELLAASEKGWAVDAENMRPTKINAHQGSDSKINGEILLYPNVDNRCILPTGLPIIGNYYSIGTVTVLNHVVEFWADEDKVGLPFIRIDGWIVAQAKTLALFPLLKEFPLQISINDSCVGGEVCVTDFNIAPFVLNVEDMLKSSGIDPATNLRDAVKFPCTQKYFNDFDIAKYQVQLNRPVDHPIFVEVMAANASTNLIGRKEEHGTGGMKAGSYQYSIRFSNAAGDTTLFSENTPLIPVPKGLSSNSTTYPGAKTFGANPATVTPFGIHIRFRVSNILDFEQIEVKRTSFIAGAAIGVLGIEEIVTKIKISEQEFSIIDFYDRDNTLTSVITVEEVVDTLSTIQSAKAIRYYNSRLFLMNIKYESRDLTGKVEFDQMGGKEMRPFSFSLGKQGYHDIYNDVYKKSYMRGEKFGWASVFYDGNGARTFGLEIPNFKNVKMPERRDKMDSFSYNLSTSLLSNSLYAVAQDSTPPFTTVNRTFEVFDLVDGVQKTGAATASAQAPPPPILNILEAGSKNGLNGADYYRPFHPINDGDSDITEHLTNINPEVKIEGGISGAVYNPQGFSPNLYSLGMALAGIKKMPSFVKAFSLVRTAPAGRIVAQGQSFYQLDDDHSNVEKRLDKVWWQSPDVYSGIVNFASQIESRLSTLNIQTVSALGFFSEVYCGRHIGEDFPPPATQVSDGIDIIHYARILEDHGQININSGSAISVFGITSGANKYVAFNSWRNTFLTSVDPNETFTISSMFLDGRGGQHRNKPYTIQFPSSFYANQATLGQVFYKDADVKHWHEPVYVMNVIDPLVDVPDSNIKEYFETGAYVKVESIISISDGLTKKYYLVDERWEDCIPALASIHPTASQDRYVYLQDEAGNEEVWLNVTFKSAAQIAIIKAAIAAPPFYYVSTRVDGSVTKITGIYTHTNTGNRLFTIEFNQTNTVGTPFIPLPKIIIIVRYDHNAPIEVFGGDAFIGDFNYCPVDAHLNSSINGFGELDPTSAADKVFFDRPMPYHDFSITEQEFIIRNTQGLNKIQDNNIIKLVNDLKTQHGFVRQQLVSGIIESRINTALEFGNRFPEVNYVMHPYRWKTDDPPNNLFAQYFTDYPQEDSLFGYGGFRFTATDNADYSALPVNLKHFSKPKVGFKENTHFCTQAIYSQKRPINKSSAPGLLTFPPLHVFDLGDETGAIKFAWDAMAGNGTNLYAITEHGIAMLLTEKRLLTELSGAQLAAIGSTDDSVIQEAVWISKSVGMNDEWWRSKAEWDNTLYFSNRNSSFRLNNNKLDDIGKMLEGSKYYKRLSEVIQSVGQGYLTDVTAMYDILDNEYWLQVNKHRTKIGFFLPPIFANIYVYFVRVLPPPPPASLPISFLASNDQIFSVENDQISYIDIRLLTDFASSDEQFIFIVNNQTLPVVIYHDPTLNPVPAPAVILVTILSGETYRISRNEPVPVGPPNPMWVATIESLTLSQIPVWSEKTGGSWIGRFKHYFDRYTTIENRMFGSRDIETWELNKGYIMNGAPVEAWALQATVGGATNLSKSKEFIRLRIAGDGEPQRVDFYDNIEQFDAGTPTGTLDILTNPQFSLKDYGAYEQYVPRKTAPPRNRQQGRLMLFKIMHNLESAFKIIDTSITFKNLK